MQYIAFAALPIYTKSQSTAVIYRFRKCMANQLKAFEWALSVQEGAQVHVCDYDFRLSLNSDLRFVESLERIRVMI